MNEFEVQPTPNGQSQPTATLTPSANGNGHAEQPAAEGGTNTGEIDRIREVLNWIHGGYARPLRAFGETGDASKLVKVRDLLCNLVVKNV